jgi:hypothetical protein
MTIDKEIVTELTADELDAVAGGTPKLYEAACRGNHLPEVVIEGGTGPYLLGTPAVAMATDMTS